MIQKYANLIFVGTALACAFASQASALPTCSNSVEFGLDTQTSAWPLSFLDGFDFLLDTRGVNRNIASSDTSNFAADTRSVNRNIASSDTNDFAADTRGINRAWADSADIICDFSAGIPGDFNNDKHVDADDLAIFIARADGPQISYCHQSPTSDCSLAADRSNKRQADFDKDCDVDSSDFAIFQRCWSGSNPADPNCAN